MITIEEREPNKLPGLSSLFVSFNYNVDIVNLIKTIPAVKNYDTKTHEWEIPISDLSKILDALCKYDKIQLNVLKDKVENKPKNFDLAVHKTAPYPYQAEGIQYGLNHSKFLLLDQPGLGKAVTLDTKVYTPTGFKLMKDIQVGDYVFSNNGLPTKVLNTFEHTNLEMYEVTFCDGTKIKCCKDHLWELHTKTRGKLIRPLSWLLENDQFGKPRNFTKFWIPQTEPVEFEQQQIPLHPYILGCLLGDGCISHSVGIASADEELIKHINNFLPTDYVCKKTNSKYYYSICKNTLNNQFNENIIKTILKQLKLFGTTSSNKFVPQIYKFNTSTVRLELLRGLLDTAGFIGKENIVQYSTCSSQLKDDVIFLAESLGGICTTYSKIPICNGKPGLENYIVTLKFSDPTILFTLTRKKERLKIRHFKPRRKIKSIIPIEEQQGKCITVDSPSALYIVDHFIVTHNTLQTIILAEELKARESIEHCLIICGINTLKANWVKEIAKHSNLDCMILGQRVRKNGKIITGGIKERVEDLKKPIKEFFVIINIESLRSDEILKALDTDKINKFDMILVDEVHKFANPSSQQSKHFIKLKQGKYRIAMTGTLLTNSPLNAWTALKFIEAENSTYTNFKYYYCNFTGPFNNILLGYRNISYLKDQLQKYGIRRTKDILKLPPKNIINEYVDMEDDQKFFYENIVNGIVDQIDKVELNTSNLLAMMARLRQAADCPSMLTTEKINNAKATRTIDLVEEIIDNGDKVVIFDVFKQPLTELYEKLKDYNPLLCTGDIADSIISENIDKFQTDEKYKVMLCTTQKLGTGVTLVAASYAIFLNTPYTYAEYEQCQDRIARIGQTKPAFIYNLLCTNTVDERVKEIVESKEMISDYIIDNKCSANLKIKLAEIITDLKKI